MRSTYLVQLAMDHTGLNQKALSEALGVSQTQITKWKKGEYMSSDMDSKLRAMSNIGFLEPGFVAMAGSLADARKWARLIGHLGELAYEGAETGYETATLREDNYALSLATFETLAGMGVTLNSSFPAMLDVVLEHEEDDGRDPEVGLAAIKANPVSALIMEMYLALNDVYGFHAAYIADLSSSDIDFEDGTDKAVHDNLLRLAASKLDVDGGLAPRARQFNVEVRTDYAGWLRVIKERAFQAGVPLPVELMHLVNDGAGALGHQAEAMSLGFADDRIHPDVYINELLVGMREIQRVLPVIVRKLGLGNELEGSDGN